MASGMRASSAESCETASIQSGGFRDESELSEGTLRMEEEL